MKSHSTRFLAALLIAFASGALALSLPKTVDASSAPFAVETAPHQQQPSPPLLSNIQAIAAGENHTCALTASGGVKCWGLNSDGQLGDGTTEDRLTPVVVTGLSSGVQAIAAGYDHTCALTAGGGVKCWGDNEYAQLGDGTTTDRMTPVDVVGLSSGVQAIAAGGWHNCALTVGGGVKCWDFNSTPVDVIGLSSGVQAIAAGGGGHTCALTLDSGVKCWGYNGNGQLGDGTIEDRLTPVDVVGLTNGVQAITAGFAHTCALTVSGGAKCWGRYDKVPYGPTIDHLTPVDVVGLSSGVQAIAASIWHTCALTTGGGVKCWGYNGSGRLGDGTSGDCDYCLTPVDVVGLSSGVQAIAVGGWHTCALTAGGGVKCWGDNDYGQLGEGTTPYLHLTPVDVVELGSGVQAIAAGDSNTCVLTAGGGVKCWGSSTLGDGRNNGRWTPVDVVGLSSGVQAIAVGEHTCALTAGGGVKCWGYNGYGQLGDGTIEDRLTPVDVVGLTNGVQAITVGDDHTCALTVDGGVKCWGDNEDGQLGDGTTDDSLAPVDVVGLSSGVQTIAAGDNHTCALTASGGVKCWGSNYTDQLGDGTTDDHWTPVDVVGLSSGVQAITADWGHTCALTAGGGVKCWGENWDGQLGDGTNERRLTPVDVVGLSGGVQAIAAGWNHTCAVTAGGGVKCWGNNGFGHLGDGTTEDRWTPADVVGLSSGVQAIAAGWGHTCALTASGGVKCWGSNHLGQLGVNPGWTPVDVVAGPLFVRGRVVDINLVPVVNAAVNYVNPSGELTTLYTDAAGAFSFTATNTGQYVITVEKPEYSFFPDVTRCPALPDQPCEFLFLGAQAPNDIPFVFLPSVSYGISEEAGRNALPHNEPAAVQGGGQ